MLKNLPIWFSANHLKIEVMLVTLVACSALINYSDVNGGDVMLMLAMTILASYYFLIGRLLPLADGWLGNMTTQIVSISSSVAVIGLLFTALHFRGAKEMLTIGSIVLVFSCIPLVYYQLKSSDNKYLLLIIRVVILGVLSALTLRDLPEQPLDKNQPAKPPIAARHEAA